MSSHWESPKLLQELVSHELAACLSAFNLLFTPWIIVISSKGCIPDNFEPHDSVKLSFTNIWGLCSKFAECESFLKSNSHDIFTLCDTNLDDSIDSGNFSVRGYLPLIQKFYYSYAWSCSLSEKGLPFPWDLPLTKLCGFLLVFDWLYFTQYLTPFSFINHLLRRYLQFAISISSNIDEFPSINPSADVFVFGDFNVHHKDWLTYSGVTDRPGELCYKFS